MSKKRVADKQISHLDRQEDNDDDDEPTDEPAALASQEELSTRKWRVSVLISRRRIAKAKRRGVANTAGGGIFATLNWGAPTTAAPAVSVGPTTAATPNPLALQPPRAQPTESAARFAFVLNQLIGSLPSFLSTGTTVGATSAKERHGVRWCTDIQPGGHVARPERAMGRMDPKGSGKS